MPIKLFAKYKFYYMRGWFYFSTLQAIVIFTIGFKTFYNTLSQYNVPMELLYLGAAISVVILPPLLGMADFRGVAPVENQKAWEVTPMASELCRKVDIMYERMMRDEDDKK